MENESCARGYAHVRECVHGHGRDCGRAHGHERVGDRGCECGHESDHVRDRVRAADHADCRLMFVFMFFAHNFIIPSNNNSILSSLIIAHLKL